MNNSIEIEFACDLETPPRTPRIFNLLQIRPVVHSEESSTISLEDVKPEDTIIYSESALGHGVFRDISDLVYVKPESFNPSRNRDLSVIIENLNSSLAAQGKGYVLIGPGRWGSTDPWLGIPVKWAQISAVRLIVESGLENYRIDPSQGTHFFQNLTSFGVGYFNINPFIDEGYYDVDYLNSLRPVYEDDALRHVRFEKAIDIRIDGRTNKGVIMKPE